MTSLVNVFGGTGFLGRRVVDRLTCEGLTVRAAVRHPKRAADVARTGAGRIVPTEADVRDKKAVTVAVAGVDGVVNAVSAYVQKGDVTYTVVHVHGAGNVAWACARQGIARLVHMSGIRADPDSRSP